MAFIASLETAAVMLVQTLKLENKYTCPQLRHQLCFLIRICLNFQMNLYARVVSYITLSQSVYVY